MSSKSGSADVLTALGVNIELTPDRVGECIDEVGIGFLFAPLYHEAIKHCAGVRQDMGIRTLFNVLGPLTNPAGATHQVIGVYDPRLTDVLGQVLLQLGSHHCFVVHGMDGLDEMTLCDRTKISEGKSGVVSNYFCAPEEFGLSRVARKELTGGSPEDNARIIHDMVQGKKSPKRDIACLNAAPALVAAGAVKTLEGVRLAQRTIDSGAAAEKLDRLIAYTQKRVRA